MKKMEQEKTIRASMGPPHDGGGELARGRRQADRLLASMGPPHDGGGEARIVDPCMRSRPLQWGRLTMEAERRSVARTS